MTGCVPDLEFDLGALVLFGSIVGVEDGGLVERGERLLRPRHDNGCFADGGVTHEDQLHVVLLVLIHHWFVVRYYLHHLTCYNLKD